MEIKQKKVTSYVTDKLVVPHEGGKLTFQYPVFRGYSADVANAIDKAGLKRPNSPETASLVYDALQNLEGKYESEIVEIMKNAWYREFTGNLYLPKSNEEINNGVIIDNNPIFENGKLIMNKNDLIKRLNENDSNVKFVPFGFKTGSQKVRELANNDYIKARYGKEGAEKIAEIASQYNSNPYLYSFDSVDEEKTRLSALTRYWYAVGRLSVIGNSWYDYDDGHSFGVVKD